MKQIFFPLLIIFALACGLAYCSMQPQKPELKEGYYDQSIPMIDPDNRDPKVNNLNSETNLNNSQANQTNETGRYIHVVGDAQATKIAAEACAIRNDCNSNPGAKPLEVAGIIWGSLLVVVVVGFILFVISRLM
jgi:hypothetical protein